MKAALTVGRFNPLTRGHTAIFDLLVKHQVENMRLFVFIVDGEKSSLDKTKNPLSAKERAKIIKTLYPIVTVDIVGSAFDIFDVLEIQGYVPSVWVCGSDRTLNYSKLSKHAGYDCKFVELDRVAGNAKDVSATLARKAALSGNTELFISLMPNKLDELTAIDIMNKIRDVNGV